MKKKLYITPETVVVAVEQQLMQSFSGGENNGDVNVTPEEDLSEDVNRSLRNSYWDFDDDEDF